MIEETRLEDAYPDIEGTDAASHLGILYLNQDEHGGVELSPRAQFDLLEVLYNRRYALYHATHLSLGANDPRDTQRAMSKRAEMWKVDDDGEPLIVWHTERVLR